MFFFITGCAVPTGYKTGGFVTTRELEVARLVTKGHAEFLRNRFENAVIDFEEALLLSPESRTIKHNLTLTYLRIGDFEAAHKGWVNLLKQNPNNPDYYFELGNLEVVKHNYRNALNYFKQALHYRDQLDLEANEKDVTDKLKESLFIKSVPVTRAVINTAMMEVAFRAGFWNEARCYAEQSVVDQVLLDPANYLAILRASKVILATGDANRAKQLLWQYVPSVIRNRSASMTHFLALVALEEGDLNRFLELVIATFEAFDSDDTVIQEAKLIVRLLQNPFDEPISESGVVDMVKFWPPKLKELTVTYNATAPDLDDANIHKLKTIADKLSVELDKRGYPVRDQNVFDNLLSLIKSLVAF